jgi:hypothetical protein
MRTSMAYFAGVGTVVAALTVGVGGGLIISNVVSPHEPKIEMSKLEQRMSERPIQATNVSPEPVPNVAAAAPVVVAPPPAQNQPQGEPVTTASTQPQPAQAAAGAPTAAPVTQATAPEKTNSEQTKAPDAAFAKARDSDLKPRDADVKARDADARAERREARRAAEEKRRAERRQWWVERRRPRQDSELRDVEASVRQETEQPRGFFGSEPVRLETPRIKLFDADD